jgi:PAS domain S-box-containing protein
VLGVRGPDAARWEESAERLLADLQRYRELYENAPDGYVVTDPLGNIEEANWAAAALFRTNRALLVGKPLPFLVVPEERRSFYSFLAMLQHQPESVQRWEVRLQPRRSPPVAAILTATPVLDAEGRPAGLRWLIRDLTARKKAEEDLRAEKEFVSALLDTAQAFVLVLDPDGRMVRLNTYVETVSGYRREELLGQDFFTRLIPEADRAAVREAFKRALADARASRMIHPLSTRDGGLRTVAWRGKLLASLGGLAMALAIVGDDITDLQEAQRQALQYERLAAIGQVATGLAHESRNALQRGQACLERLRWMLQGQPQVLDLVARVKKAQDDLARLYEDVREYAVPIRLEYRRCDLAAVWREAWTQLTVLAPERYARLDEDTDGTDTVCAADPFRLIQVFRNVLDNTLAACPDPVQVRITCRDATLAGRPALLVVVRDNGPGFAAEQQRHLFEPFHTTKVKGTGLGLAIVKRIVEAHRGQVAAGAAPAPGAEIIITLPRSQE